MSFIADYFDIKLASTEELFFTEYPSLQTATNYHIRRVSKMQGVSHWTVSGKTVPCLERSDENETVKVEYAQLFVILQQFPAI